MLRKFLLSVQLLILSVFTLTGQGRLNNFALSKGDLIENLLFNYYDDYGFNGSVLVVENGINIYENTFGFTDFEREIPLDADSPFYIASLAKQFTAAAIVKLAEDGKLSYTDPITRFLPLMPDYYSKVKINHLLTHTAGVADYFALGIGKAGVTNLAVYEALIAQSKLEFSPGSKYKYSNSGYVLLAMVVEIASGQKISDYFQDNIFEPYGMGNSFIFSLTTLNRDRVKGYSEKLKPDDYNLFTIGDGGIYSTAHDLYLWEEALNNGQFISKNSLDMVYSPLVLKNGSTRKYGYGWEIGSNTQGKLVYHTGGLAGFRAYIERQIDAKNAIIILTNNSFTHVLELRNMLVKILDGRIDTIPDLNKDY